MSSSATDSYRAARDFLLANSHDVAAAHAGFEWPDVGESFNWAVDWFDQIAADNERIALWVVEEDGREQQLSFEHLRVRSNQVANWLRSIGIGHGDRVMLMIDNRVELWESMLALLKIGAVILPTSVVLGPEDLAERVERAVVRGVIADGADSIKFDELPGVPVRITVGAARSGWHNFSDSAQASTTAPAVTVASTDPSIIYFTSGTTSRPKMVEHTHLSYPVGHLSTTYWIGVRPGDVHMTISAPGWGKHAWSLFFAPWIAEATIFVFNYSRFDAAKLVEQLDRAGVNTFCAPPTVWRMLIQAVLEHKPHGLRELLSAGEPLNPEVIATIRNWWGLDIRDGYGQTELTAVIGNPPGAQIVPGAMGHALPGVQIELIDPITGKPADEGEICLPLNPRPLNLMAGYLGDAERTAQVEADGYFHTSDVAVRDENGCITFVGRTDDVFKASDFKVSPFEVESILLEHPFVAEAAVVGAPDDLRLNVVKAYVALGGGAEATPETARAILAHAREHMPPYMRVRRLEFFDLPKTISGKIRRVELRERELAAHPERLPGEYRDSDFPDLKAEA